MENELHNRGKRGLRKILPSEFEGLLFMLFVSTSLQVFARLPTIASFSPPIGPVGTAVTITGTNFNPTPANNIVFFGSIRAIVLGGTPSVLSVAVPAGASYSPLVYSPTVCKPIPDHPFLSRSGLMEPHLEFPLVSIARGRICVRKVCNERRLSHPSKVFHICVYCFTPYP